MGAIATSSPNPPSYVLRDELAQLCLPVSSRDPQRTVAWVNAICVLFLIIGTVGIEKPVELVLGYQNDDPVFVPIEESKQIPLPPPEELSEANPDTAEKLVIDTPTPPPAVAVADPSTVAFAVTVENATLLSANPVLAPPPPREIPKPTAVPPMTAPPAPAASPRKEARPGWGFGNFPEMGDGDYPLEARKRGEEGVATIEWTVNADGSVSNIRVRNSSGSPALDRAAMSWVRTRYRFDPPGKTKLLYYTFTFKLAN